MATVTELLQKAEQDINCSSSARLDAEILLCDVMRFNRSKIYSHPDQPVADEKLTLFKSLIEQRRQGHPIAHLTGKKEFWSLELAINEDTLIPRPETECLVETSLQLIPDDKECNILDLGTGSGAIAIAIASERPHCNIIATDINANALAMAKKNAAFHGLTNIQFLVSDWYKNIPSQTFDLIVSNPPYIKQDDEHLSQGDVRFEPKLALIAGTDGMQAINIILELAKTFLASDARLLVEHGYDQKELVRHGFLVNGFNQVTTIQDLSGQDRITYGHTLN
ncbi:MAG: peptide chain release factor N(5)-glutamine methyltransferase [Gammaproteobacteria bacterium]|nr:peptide chain release factor N(5)-glutamine methyltransferase [Gammaproteobacteria bacterium]